MFVAWGDESGSVSAVDPGVYLMGAVLAAPETTEHLREAMRELLRPSEKKVHWYGASESHRDRIIDVVADLTLEAVVVARLGELGERDERRRRKCFETFAPTLASMGCTHLTLESRGPRDDARDRKMLEALRAQRRVDSTLRLDHVPGPADPVLWIADAVCGAVVADRVGQSRWLTQIERRTSVYVIDDRPRR
ncbi:hypothetical protein Xcel_2605 [Xylanimonas cellulosilytica DSM 15894]|uniref:DUF3800 domain-containing protein n=1 Tax=Xylanimonas cellulosilytica (strain DSM 15894 / JCM 12276 / CECT 5975 / KCTC 9989 / LMG 20990 / NBRC 107835 / XIL07) TaxID=446471 RepID=D1BX51_XYLCX|nr:hypothetical protein Xcel_2605 [Xylanimonas cellulosilytica DSM 15894]